ncbi:MAG: hypothetical protein GY913_08280 [Proteobacteria bacterium]|nr:hypothetical protein [Pseudomonadota bacterium]MCP4916907.1 hypothetical protein [Pseudomonadota bacterium]
MSSERKKQQKRQKASKKRSKKQAVRRSRNASNKQVKGAGLSDMLEWPLAEAWIGQDWHERGARFPAVITREHSSGDMAAAVFDVDLSGPGIVKAELLTHISRPELQSHLARISEAMPMMEIAPGHVLGAVDAGWNMNGESLPPGFARARALFGELEADARIEFLTGPPEVAQKKQGWLSKLLGKRD